MVKKKFGKTLENDNELYILPTANDEMRVFVDKFKVDMMEHIVSSIKFAVENNLQLVEIFQFKNSPFVVTMVEKEFVPNLEHISQFYKEHQIFELCSRVEQLRKILKHKTNEKEKPDRSRPDNPEY